MRGFSELFAIILMGLALGGALAWVSIQNNQGFGALRIGEWTAWPLAGSRDADPYSKAKVAAEGAVPLGAAEGLAFHADQDKDGNPLRRDCQYMLEGQTPPARLWTLSAHAPEGPVLTKPDGQSVNVISRSIVRAQDGKFTLYSGPEFSPGNWLEVDGRGSYELILRLYDSPITSTSGIVDPQMPSISLMSCQS